MSVSVTVRIPTQLRELTDGSSEVTAAGSNVEEVVHHLDDNHPGIGGRLLDDSGHLRRFVNLYIDGEDIRFLDGLKTEIPQRAELSIIPAVAGG